ncbi:hypothetical protein FRUB_03281 [Fimbriiglobus ruber]|uniref:Uncharacterized protein n=1 Tax=Fimbriiglobus ruber TaxID=1908690 RepID=A0A225DQL1_9BACT|nr:hypothetical protein FRUB_03281 [Fimbriiglobus ruber]
MVVVSSLGLVVPSVPNSSQPACCAADHPPVSRGGPVAES